MPPTVVKTEASADPSTSTIVNGSAPIVTPAPPELTLAEMVIAVAQDDARAVAAEPTADAVLMALVRRQEQTIVRLRHNLGVLEQKAREA